MSKLFVSLTNVGLLDDKDNPIKKSGRYNGRLIGRQNQPLVSVILPLLEEVIRFSDYSSDLEAIKDLVAFQEVVKKLGVTDLLGDKYPELANK